ncbi:biotin transporter BioY [Chelatococcus sp. SYSU_G07232]|uniref:Biotin transporter n=1 Tax=Chelatococcus albus TaxID=3047466 RepID=A0ABT7AC53_9HYPH|nr:biotin transporter BioY [Chelatococcus sp. SYSU_G07232]MDJ1156946.1 biotin transporter BioY [Chelatococcus sp. SYSU_G07232]
MASQTLARLPVARLAAGSAARRLAVILAGSWLLAAASWIEVPMYPVPMTMQTYAVLVIGALCGLRLASETVGAYLLQGALGLPVFAGGAAGYVHFLGPTGGFLVGFLLAAALIGWLADHGWNASPARLALSLTAGHLLLFAPGLAHLAGFVGAEKAIGLGWTPFVAGTALKTALAFATVVGLTRYVKKDSV